VGETPSLDRSTEVTFDRPLRDVDRGAEDAERHVEPARSCGAAPFEREVVALRLRHPSDRDEPGLAVSTAGRRRQGEPIRVDRLTDRAYLLGPAGVRPDQ